MILKILVILSLMILTKRILIKNIEGIKFIYSVYSIVTCNYHQNDHTGMGFQKVLMPCTDPSFLSFSPQVRRVKERLLSFTIERHEKISWPYKLCSWSFIYHIGSTSYTKWYIVLIIPINQNLQERGLGSSLPGLDDVQSP